MPADAARPNAPAKAVAAALMTESPPLPKAPRAPTEVVTVESPPPPPSKEPADSAGKGIAEEDEASVSSAAGKGIAGKGIAEEAEASVSSASVDQGVATAAVCHQPQETLCTA